MPWKGLVALRGLGAALSNACILYRLLELDRTTWSLNETSPTSVTGIRRQLDSIMTFKDFLWKVAMAWTAASRANRPPAESKAQPPELDDATVALMEHARLTNDGRRRRKRHSLSFFTTAQGRALRYGVWAEHVLPRHSQLRAAPCQPKQESPAQSGGWNATCLCAVRLLRNKCCRREPNNKGELPREARRPAVNEMLHMWRVPVQASKAEGWVESVLLEHVPRASSHSAPHRPVRITASRRRHASGERRWWRGMWWWWHSCLGEQ